MSKQFKEGDLVVLKGTKHNYPYADSLTIGKMYVVGYDSCGAFIQDAVGDDVSIEWLTLSHWGGEPPCPLCVKHKVKKQLKKAEKKVLKLKSKLKGLA